MRTPPIALLLILQVVMAHGEERRAEPAINSPHRTGTATGTTGVDQNEAREGGESFGDARVIAALPYTDSGNTCDNMNDVSPPCAYGASPDVVYRFSPSANGWVCLSLCGSSYDTVLGVYDASQNCIACNDDSCGLQSQLRVHLDAGRTYYFVVDGYGTDCGNYVFNPVGCAMPGACCFEDGTCRVLDWSVCIQEGGTFQGVGTTCEPDPCMPVPIERTSWGRIKSSFR